MASSLYYGSHDRKVDYKGRIGIPDDLTALATGWERAVLVRASETLPNEVVFPCIFLYDADRWQDLLETAQRELGDDANEARMFMLRVVSDAATVDVDAMKRITLPERFLDHAGIGRQAGVRVVGIFNHIEFWNPETHDSYVTVMNSLEVPVPSLFELARRDVILRAGTA